MFPDADRLLFRGALSVWIMQTAGQTIANSALHAALCRESSCDTLLII
jgi:hypothetical protein